MSSKMTEKQLARLKSDLIEDEGKRQYPYKCTAGKITIGVGRNLEDKGLRADEIDYLFNNDLEEYANRTKIVIPFFDQLNEVRQNVLINMAFNLGIHGLLTFQKALGAMLKEDFERAAEEMLNSKWATQVGARAERLAREMKTGQWM